MIADRYVLLGLARPRVPWFATVSRWATSGSLPVEFVRCVSLEELRTRLRSDRPYSALLIEGGLPGLDRDLVAEATEAGVAVLVVDDGPVRDWRALGVVNVLSSDVQRAELVEVLSSHARPIGAARVQDGPAPSDEEVRGDLIAVTGPGGTGASTLAIAIAQGLAEGGRRTPGRRRGGGLAPRTAVLLADLCRRADQAMLHDSRVVVPSIQELVDAHRTGTPDPQRLLEQTFEVPARGYRLLLGLRRPRHWVTLRPRAVESTLDSLLRLAEVVVADLEPDVEGEAETGSADVQDRHLLARAALARAVVVVIVGEPSMKGIRSLVGTVEELVEFGVPPARLLPVFNRSPRRPRQRAGATATFTELLRATVGAADGELVSPLHVPHRSLEEALRDGVALPAPLPRDLARSVAAVRDRAGATRVHQDRAPQPVLPGSLSLPSIEGPR